MKASAASNGTFKGGMYFSIYALSCKSNSQFHSRLMCKQRNTLLIVSMYINIWISTGTKGYDVENTSPADLMLRSSTGVVPGDHSISTDIPFPGVGKHEKRKLVCSAVPENGSLNHEDCFPFSSMASAFVTLSNTYHLL